MRELVVLVGLPGSGKSAFQEKQANWAVVSKDAIRRATFRVSFDSSYEGAVDRIYASTLIEAAESDAPIVCVDDLNLLRSERASLVELGRMTGRETVAVVMPYEPVDTIYQLAQFQLEELTKQTPKLAVAGFPRDRFDAMLRCYEAVQPDEGFARIEVETMLPLVSGITSLKSPSRRSRVKREEKQNPIPLFAA